MLKTRQRWGFAALPLLSTMSLRRPTDNQFEDPKRLPNFLRGVLPEKFDADTLDVALTLLRGKRQPLKEKSEPIPEFVLVKLDGGDQDEEDAKQKIAKLVDKVRTERGDALRAAREKQKGVLKDERERQKGEEAKLEKKYPHITEFNNSGCGTENWKGTQKNWKGTRWWPLDYKIYQRIRGIAEEKGGQEGAFKIDRKRAEVWDSFKACALKDTDEGNRTKHVAYEGVLSGGLGFRIGDLSQPSNINKEEGKQTWQELMAGVLKDASKPGVGARVLTAFYVRDALNYATTQLYGQTGPTLLAALRELAKNDKNGAPLTSDQVTIITRQALANLLDFKKNGKSLKELEPEFLVALVNNLVQDKDKESVPLIKELLKSPDASVRRAAAVGLSNLAIMPSEEWAAGVHIPDPRLTAETRAERVRQALEKKDKSDDKYIIDSGLGEPIVEAIASAYKAPKGATFLTDKNDPGIKYLDKALDSEHLAVRLMAAQVLAESDLDVATPVRKKAIAILVDTILNNDVGTKATKEAIDLLETSLGTAQSLKTDKYTIAKVKDFLPGLKTEIPNIHDCLLAQDDEYFYSWLADGSRTYSTRREAKFGQATLKRGIFDVSAKYISDCGVEWRKADLDGNAVTKMSWQPKGATAPYVAVRLKVNDKYIDEYEVTIPGKNKNDLSHTVRVKGKFEMSRETGYFRYRGQDFTDVDETGKLLHPERTIIQSQGIKDDGIKQYSNRP
jgi:HEAT repeat protein